MTAYSKGLLAILISAILWASAGATAKILFHFAPPFVVAFHRFLLASLIIFPFFWNTKKPKGYIKTLLPLGLFNAGNILFFYSGLPLTTANSSSILGTTVPLITMILSGFLIHESISIQTRIGIVLGLFGTLLIIIMPLFGSSQSIAGSLHGNLLILGSVISWSLYIVYSRHTLSKGAFSPIISTAINIFVVTVVTGIAALLTERTITPPIENISQYIWLIAYAAIGITVITFFLFQWGVQHVPATTAALKDYIQLIIGVGLNSFLLGEHLTTTYIIGSIFVGLGVFIATGRHWSKKIATLVSSRNN